MEGKPGRRNRRLPRRTRETEILRSVAEALNRSADVRTALERTLALAAELLGLRAGWVWLRDDDSGRFYSAATRNLPPLLRAPVRMTGESCWCLDAFRAGRLAPGNVDMMDCSRLRAARDASEDDGLRCHASVPLYFQDRPLGVLNVAAPGGRELTGRELRLLAAIADQAGVAIERARLADEAAQTARLEERARLARELHDTLAQGLTAIGLQVEGALRAMERDPERARERLARALELTRESLDDARRSVRRLRGAAAAGRPLPEALRGLARRVTAESGIRVRLRLADTDSLTADAEDELFRIAQEALANTVKHSRAVEARVTLSRRDGRVRLTIADDGVGFDRRAPTEGSGLAGMRERARLLGGGLRVTGGPGRGTRVTVWTGKREE